MDENMRAVMARANADAVERIVRAKRQRDPLFDAPPEAAWWLFRYDESGVPHSVVAKAFAFGAAHGWAQGDFTESDEDDNVTTARRAFVSLMARMETIVTRPEYASGLADMPLIVEALRQAPEEWQRLARLRVAGSL